MATNPIRYRSGYKYQLVEEYVCNVERMTPETDIQTEFIELSTTGRLVIRKNYAWDGATAGIDTRNFMRGSLVHDALYQLMRVRSEQLPKARWREAADQELHRICREDGMSRARAWWVLRGVRIGGEPAASPESRKPIHTAP